MSWQTMHIYATLVIHDDDLPSHVILSLQAAWHAKLAPAYEIWCEGWYEVSNIAKNKPRILQNVIR